MDPANQEMFNDEIEDIDSDDEVALAYQYQQAEQAQKTQVKVPGLSLGGIGAPTHFTMQQPDQSAKPMPALNLGGNKVPPMGLGGD